MGNNKVTNVKFFILLFISTNYRNFIELILVNKFYISKIIYINKNIVLKQ